MNRFKNFNSTNSLTNQPNPPLQPLPQEKLEKIQKEEENFKNLIKKFKFKNQKNQNQNQNLKSSHSSSYSSSIIYSSSQNNLISKNWNFSNCSLNSKNSFKSSKNLISNSISNLNWLKSLKFNSNHQFQSKSKSTHKNQQNQSSNQNQNQQNQNQNQQNQNQNQQNQNQNHSNLYQLDHHLNLHLHPINISNHHSNLNQNSQNENSNSLNQFQFNSNSYHHQKPPLPPKDPKMNYFNLNHHSNLNLIQPSKNYHQKQLKQLYCPNHLINTFINIAIPETNRKVELCGFLLGKLSIKFNTLIINTLLIPNQISTSDTCATINEEEIFNFQQKSALLTLGWIHTHPTQTCFMSSVDLHTHASYQVILPEAVAIVCSPNHLPRMGVFRLTDPPGLQTILNCKNSNLFHHHPDHIPIYTNADQNHFIMINQIPLEIIDLRN